MTAPPPMEASPAGAVVLDLATHPISQWAVIVGNSLLPIRFTREGEAIKHLDDILAKNAEDAS